MLPGIGPKSAQRMAFHLLQHDREGASMLSRALYQAAFFSTISSNPVSPASTADR